MVVPMLIVATLLMLLIMIGAIWGINIAMARMVGDKHQVLQALIETGQVPPEWSRPFQRRIARLTHSHDNSAQIAELQERARCHYLRKLDRLVSYVQTSPFVDGEETRNLLLEKLADIRVSWQEKMQ
jgi:hypothetical protein